MRAFVITYKEYSSDFDAVTYYYDGPTIIDVQHHVPLLSAVFSAQDFKTETIAKINTYAASMSYNLSEGIIFSWETATRTPSALSLSIQTSTGAVGTQVSTANDAEVSVGATIVTAATLLSGAVGTMVLEVAPTNSATAGDWVEYGRVTNGQVFSLAVAIGCTQTIAGQMNAFVPAGYYVKVRSISTTGTPTFSINSSRKVLL